MSILNNTKYILYYFIKFRMSIEDVDYMKQNSIKENYTFIVDSKFRNQEEYPNPNNYVVNFDIPFKNVFGIEVLDVSVPKTMYNIDNNSNKFYIYINTTKNEIINYLDMAEGLKWEKFDNIKNIQDTEIINYILSDNLKNNSIIDNINNYGITNLNKYNYISVVDILQWNRIVIDITSIDNNSKYTSTYNPKLSEDLKINQTFDNLDELNEYGIENLRTYNVIPIIDSSDIIGDAEFFLKWYNIGTELIENNYGLKWEYIGNTKPNLGEEIPSQKININKFEIFLELSYEELELLTIDKNKNNYIKINNNYYKPKTNIDICNKWVYIDIGLDNFHEYKNISLGGRIKDKIYDKLPLSFTNQELNNYQFDFNNSFNIFIKIITGLKWRISNNYNVDGQNLITKQFIINLIKIKYTNSYLSIIDLYIDDITDSSDIYFLKNNINEKSYIIIDSRIWITEYTTYIPDGTSNINEKIKKEWLINKDLVNLIKNTNNYEEKYNKIIIDETEWNNLNINKNELLSNTIILVDNYYYNICPTYHYIANVNYYYATDILNVNIIDDYQKLLDLFFELFIIEIPIGNYTLNKLIVILNTMFRENINLVILHRTIEDKDNFELELQCTGNTIPVDIQNILKFEANRYIIFDMNKSTLNKTLGFYSKVSDDLEFINNFSYLNTNKINIYEKFYHSIKIIDKYRIIAPGIVYLIGYDYIILKCPEIEEHLYGSLSYTKNTIGLAKIRVSNWGLNEESTSYLKLKLREFHPIGKLNKITLKFENAEGNLYDFRGVNHNIVFAIHYYSAKQKQKFEKSIINPEYKMNFMDYKYSQEEKEEESDIEDNENNSLINIEDYKKMEKKYSDKEYNNGYELDYNKIRETIYNNMNNDSDNE